MEFRTLTRSVREHFAKKVRPAAPATLKRRAAAGQCADDGSTPALFEDDL